MLVFVMGVVMGAVVLYYCQKWYKAVKAKWSDDIDNIGLGGTD